MADIKISELTAATTSNNTDLFETSQSDGMGGWLSKKISKSQLIEGPFNVFYASENAPSGGNGSINSPFNTFLAAYAAAAAVGTETDPSVVILEGNFTFGSWEISPYASVFGYGKSASHLTCTGTVSASAAWSNPPSVLRNLVNLNGFILTAAAINIAVTTSVYNEINIQDVEYYPSAFEQITIQGFSAGTVNLHSYAKVNYIGCSSLSSFGSTYVGGMVTRTNEIGSCRVSSIGDLFPSGSLIDCISHESKDDAFSNRTEINAPNMTQMSGGAFTFSGENTILAITSDAKTPGLSGAGIGNPTLIWQSITANIQTNYNGINYDSGNGSLFDAIEGIDDALAGAHGMITVVVNEGYVLVEDNTLYIVSSNAVGKVFFQTPPTMVEGFTFIIMGQGGNPISNWNLSTQLNQGLINGTDISNIGGDRYAILEPSSPTDRASFVCTVANQDVTVQFSSSAGLTIYEQVQIDRSLYSRTAADPLSLYAMGQVDVAYTGYLLKVQRDSDSAQAYVMPDLAYRASPLSMLNIGGTLAAWMYGTRVDIIEVMDQSGNGYDGIGGSFWIDDVGNVASMSTTLNTAMQFSGAQAFTGTYAANYTDNTLNVFALSQITADIDSSVVTLYNPANGDDYSSTLNCIAFHVPPPFTDMDTYRAGTLSVKSLPPQETRILLATRFTGLDNTLRINGIDGNTFAVPLLPFGFNSVLLSARYISGAPTNHGFYKTACVFVYPDMSSGDYDDIQTWIDLNL